MGFFDKLKKGVKSLQAMGKMDDKVAKEMYNIYGEFGYQTQDFKHKSATVKTKSDGSAKSVPEKWSWKVMTGAGPYKFKVKEEMGKMSVKVKTPQGGKNKTKFPYKNYVKRDGADITVVNREGLVEECKRIMQ